MALIAGIIFTIIVIAAAFWSVLAIGAGLGDQSFEQNGEYE